MRSISSYLTFNGNCREAMTFYHKCFGGKLQLQTIGESPLSNKMPQQMKDCILHSTLKKDGLLLMGSDMVSEKGLMKGNAVSLSLDCSSEEEINDLYEKLSTGGVAEHPLEQTFWNAVFGGLTDRYGNHWLLNYDKKQTQ